ncbi:teichoic acid transport system permease protein [Melghiribacillus thermohalophilus]|uniref:Transport permease protein n=1 Tax=Melghiribacillus thermohalophilus TaxID=1324956 RepID=A0A4R3MU70_9BACI|nr:ABC transporter permease [Melghiribacillus thermohalophilus]TCT19884.1 teichoic acid transport system permease protein [Melghiribacillus thermohalophilus]
MKAAIIVLKEQIKYFYLIRRLSLYELKSTTTNNYLGMAWEIINPSIQIAIYWFVFGYGIRQHQPVEGIPFFQWMLAGIVVWFLINQGILKGTKSIYSKIKILAKMNFPMSVIPNYVLFSQLYPHLLLLLIVIILLQLIGYPISIYYLQIPLYVFGVMSILFSITLITSTLATIAQDVQMFLQSIMRMLLYLSPILWPLSLLPDWLQTVMKINPFYYIVEGYRHSLLGKGWFFIEEWSYSLYFWALVLILFTLGSYLHVKFRRHFVDFI